MPTFELRGIIGGSVGVAYQLIIPLSGNQYSLDSIADRSRRDHITEHGRVLSITKDDLRQADYFTRDKSVPISFTLNRSRTCLLYTSPSPRDS